MYRSRSTVEIGFDASPGTLDPIWVNTGFTWTDVSAYSPTYEVTRGGPEMGGVAPGEGKVLLENSDGRFDPSNSGSPYFGDMTSGKPIRIFEQINLLSLALSTGDDVATLTAIGAPSLAVSATQRLSLSNSIRVTNGAGTIGFTTPSGTSGFPVFEGEPLTGSVWVMRTSATGRDTTVSLRFYDAAGSTVSTVTGSVVVSSGAWQQVLVQTVAPAGGVFCALRVEFASAVVGDTHYVDNLHLVPSTNEGALSWFPGGPLPVFRGQIDSWKPTQFRPGYSSTEVAVSGTLSPIAGSPFGESLWSTFVERSKPDLWWRLGQQTETDTVVDSSGNELHGRFLREVGSTPMTFVDGLIEQDADGAVNFDSTWQQYVEGPSIVWTSGTFTLAMWVLAVPAAGACTLFDSSRLTVQMTAAGAITATYLGLAATTTGRDLRDSSPHLIYVHCTAAGSIGVGIDVDGQATNTGLLGAERLMLRLYVGRDQAGTGAQYASITIDEVTLWQGVEVSADWLYLTGRAGTIRPGDVIGRLQPSDVAQFVIDLFGSPRPLGTTATPAGDSPMVIDVVPMVAPIEMLNTASTAGQLTIREAPDGVPTIDRAFYKPTLYNGFLSAVTIGQGANEYPYIGDPTVDFGESSVINHLTVSRPGTAAVVFRNQTSIDARGERPAQITLWSTVDRCARDLAAWILNQYANEGRRLTGVTPDCVRPDTAQAMLLVELGDVITVKDQTVDGRTITTVVRIVGKTVGKRRNSRGVPVLFVELSLSPIRIQPIVLDSSTYGVLGPDAAVGKWGP